MAKNIDFVYVVLQEIKRVRKERKMSLLDMGNKLGCTAAAYRSIEEGETELKVRQMQKILEILDIRLNAMIQGDANEVISYSRYDIDNFATKGDLRKIEDDLEKIKDLATKEDVARLEELLKKLLEKGKE